MLHAEIISNGDEITSGKVLDTNAQWLSLELADLGITARYHTSVEDHCESMLQVLRTAMERADLVIWTGGLGPTADDLTRQTFANAAGVPLIKDEESLRQIQELFTRRGYEMSPNNELQAFLPQGAFPIHNPNGTAPGIDLTVKRTLPIPAGRLDFVRLLAYPGVPAEMKEMWNDTGRATLQALLDTLAGEKRVIKYRLIHSFGLGESHVESLLPGMIDRDHVPKVGITATRATITLRIVAAAESEEECDRFIKPAAKVIYEKLGNRIFGEGDDTLPKVVCRQASKMGKKIAVVEAGTRGLLAESLAGVAESESCFLGGIVLPHRQAIAPEEMIALGRKMFNADYLFLIGAYPEGKPDKKQGSEVFTAVADLRESDTKRSIIQMQQFAFSGHPDIIDDLFIKRVLDLFRLYV